MLIMLLRQLTEIGGLVLYSVLIGLVFALGEVTLFWIMLINFLLIMILSSIIKAVWYVPRPKVMQFNTLLEKINAGSFPSVHSARASSLALILSTYFGGFWFTLGICTVAGMVGMSRIILQKHYFSDVLGGTLIAVLVWLVVGILV